MFIVLWEVTSERCKVGKSEAGRPLGRPIDGCKTGIKVGLKEMGWVDVDCFYVAQDRDKEWTQVNVVVTFRLYNVWGIFEQL